jgi:hypothetical protein
LVAKGGAGGLVGHFWANEVTMGTKAGQKYVDIAVGPFRFHSLHLEHPIALGKKFLAIL